METAYALRQDFLEALGKVYDKIESGDKKIYDQINIMECCFDELYKQHGELYRRTYNGKNKKSYLNRA